MGRACKHRKHSLFLKKTEIRSHLPCPRLGDNVCQVLTHVAVKSILSLYSRTGHISRSHWDFWFLQWLILSIVKELWSHCFTCSHRAMITGVDRVEVSSLLSVLSGTGCTHVHRVYRQCVHLYSQHGMWRTHCTESGECHMETRILITQHVEKNIFPRDILELACILFSARLVAVLAMAHRELHTDHWHVMRTSSVHVRRWCECHNPSLSVRHRVSPVQTCHHLSVITSDSVTHLFAILILAMECGPLTRNVLA